jgi:nucleolar protein 6
VRVLETDYHAIIYIPVTVQTKKLEKSDISPERPQRYSATSGIEQAPLTRRTWTVGDKDDGETHRGGQKHTKKRGRPNVKAWGTGVNAIPVG